MNRNGNLPFQRQVVGEKPAGFVGQQDMMRDVRIGSNRISVDTSAYTPWLDAQMPSARVIDGIVQNSKIEVDTKDRRMPAEPAASANPHTSIRSSLRDTRLPVRPDNVTYRPGIVSGGESNAVGDAAVKHGTTTRTTLKQGMENAPRYQGTVSMAASQQDQGQYVLPDLQSLQKPTLKQGMEQTPLAPNAYSTDVSLSGSVSVQATAIADKTTVKTLMERVPVPQGAIQSSDNSTTQSVPIPISILSGDQLDRHKFEKDLLCQYIHNHRSILLDEVQVILFILFYFIYLFNNKRKYLRYI
jgi:hypothetical protein